MPVKQYHHGDLKNALILAGTEILATEGFASLSLRKVAARAGVSHAAPYAHFTDKQELIAAISTEGYRRLYERLGSVAAAEDGSPAHLLIELMQTYLDFALENPARFKVMFSGVLESQTRFSELDALARKTFALLEETIARCQAAGVLRPGPQDILTLSIWSMAHGLIGLMLENQVSHRILDAYPVRELLCRMLSQVTLIEVTES